MNRLSTKGSILDSYIENEVPLFREGKTLGC